MYFGSETLLVVSWPCPFCGFKTSHIRIIPALPDGEELFAIKCDKCGAEGPRGMNYYEAVALWKLHK